jgi:hypothetical protein
MREHPYAGTSLALTPFVARRAFALQDRSFLAVWPSLELKWSTPGAAPVLLARPCYWFTRAR